MSSHCLPTTKLNFLELSGFESCYSLFNLN